MSVVVGARRIAAGYLYGGEFLWLLESGSAMIYPTWLGEDVSVTLDSEDDARAFIDAHAVWAKNSNVLYAEVG